jgi:splicing factor 3B subunit 3
LVVYEIDLGLNHVIRKFSEPVPKTAHRLISIPGGIENEGKSSGVIVACENYIIYKKQDHEDRKCSIPIRLD